MFRQVLALALLGVALGVVYDCEHNRPVGKSETPRNAIKVILPDPPKYKHGQPFVVKVETVDLEFDRLRQLSIQARDVSGQVQGSWATPSWGAIQSCGMGKMLYTETDINEPTTELVWIVPDEAFSSVIEFHVTVMFDGENYHRYTTELATLDQEEEYNPHTDPSEFAEPAATNDDEEENGEQPNNEDPDGIVGNPGENPNGGEELYGDLSHRADELDHIGEPEEPSVIDLHDPSGEILQQRDAEERRQQQIAAENANSEGDWTRQEEEERQQREREYEWELREQERTQYEEQKRREEIMLWEIRDKEEHDALMAAQANSSEEEERNNNTEDQESEEEGDSLDEIIKSDEIDIDNLVQDGDSGVTKVVVSTLLLFLAAFAVFA